MSFNWDNISIGKPDSNTSDGFFFRQQRMKNEDNLPDLLDNNTENDINYSNKITAPENIIRNTTSKSTKSTFEKAYNYAHVYEKKKQNMIEKQNKEAEEKRKFHANPVPNFDMKHKLQTGTKITVPLTPTQMKPERLQKVEEQKRKILAKIHQTPPKFKAHEAKVLQESPFVPKKDKKCVQAAPFNLRMSSRLQERKKYDDQLKQLKEEREKKEEQERKKLDEKEIKLIRKQKEFKANPNPFK